ESVDLDHHAARLIPVPTRQREGPPLRLASINRDGHVTDVGAEVPCGSEGVVVVDVVDADEILATFCNINGAEGHRRVLCNVSHFASCRGAVAFAARLDCSRAFQRRVGGGVVAGWRWLAGCRNV